MNYFDWEKMKVAGMTEHNNQIDEMRKSWEHKQELNAQINAYKNIIDELRKSNEIMQAQIDEANKISKKSNKLSIGAIAVSIFAAFIAIIDILIHAYTEGLINF